MTETTLFSHPIKNNVALRISITMRNKNHHRRPLPRRRCQLRCSSYRWCAPAFLILYFVVYHRLLDTEERLSRQQEQSLLSTTTNGVVVKEIEEEGHHDTVVHSSHPPVRFLMGIMSHNKYQMERDRRQVIRRTYLSLYNTQTTTNKNGTAASEPQQDNNNNDDSSSSIRRHRICSLEQVLAGTISLVEDNCQLVYTFVIGGGTPKTTNRTTLVTPDVNISHSSQMLVVPPVVVNPTTSSSSSSTTTTTTTTTTNDDTDVIYLNILENGKQGKSPTWLQYATLLLDEQASKLSTISFIIKTDSDTLLYPNRFFRWVEDRLVEPNSTKVLPKIFSKTHPNNHHHNNDMSITNNNNADNDNNNNDNNRLLVYGGSPFDKKMCGFPSHIHCANLTAPIYMGGAFYFVSIDLAQWIVHQTKYPHPILPFVPHEDVTTGNVVWSHPHAYEEIIIWGNKDAYLEVWRHPVKDPTRYYNLWRKFLSSRRKRQRKTTTIQHRW